MASSRKLSIALIVYTTILWISQMTSDVTADGTTSVQDTVPGSSELHQRTSTSELDPSDDVIEEYTSGTGDSQGFYQRYKQFVAKHNRTFTIVFGVLFVISLVGAIAACSIQNGAEKATVIFPLLFGIGIFGFILYKLYGKEILAFFRGKKVPIVNSTVDAVDSST